MRSWHRSILALWLALGATQPTVAQIERLRTDIEGAMGTRVVYRSRALPQLAGQFEGGLRGGSLYDSSVKIRTNASSVIVTNNVVV